MQTSVSNAALGLEQTKPVLLVDERLRVEHSERHWYAVYTCANHEKSVAERIDRRSIECFLPLYESARRWKDRRVRLELPLFPGYIFVRLALIERLKVLEIPGVVRLVGFDGHPTPLPMEDIDTIRACLARRQYLSPHPYLHRGQRVRVSRGPLEGLTGILVRKKNRTRFVISLEMLMRSVAVEIDCADFNAHPALLT